MKINIEIDEDKMKELILGYIEAMLGDLPLDKKDVKIEVKSKQNYKSEWEVANFRVRYEHYYLNI